jgi:glycosyltransferase involved in cell wall biosynthesis
MVYVGTVSEKTSFGLVVPYFNNQRSINAMLSSVLAQSILPCQIVVVDDCSDISASEIISDCIKEDLRENCTEFGIIRNPSNLGLAESYNLGINHIKSDFVVTMHPDVVLPNANEFEILLKEFAVPGVVAVGHKNIRTSDQYWNSLTCWEKAVIAPSESKFAVGFNGQFDAFRKSAALGVGGFRSKIFRTAGEDGDFIMRMSRCGLIKMSAAQAEHRHDFGDKSKFRAGIRKSLQYGNAQGAMARVHGRWFPLYREALSAVFVALIFVDINLALLPFSFLLISILRIPTLVFARDRRIKTFFALIPYELLRLAAHVVGALSGMIVGRETV